MSLSFETVWLLYTLMPLWWLLRLLSKFAFFNGWMWLHPRSAPEFMKDARLNAVFRDELRGSLTFQLNAQMVPCVAKSLSIFACTEIPGISQVRMSIHTSAHTSTHAPRALQRFLDTNPDILCFEGARHWKLVGLASMFVLLYMVLIPAYLVSQLLVKGRSSHFRSSNKQYKQPETFCIYNIF